MTTSETIKEVPMNSNINRRDAIGYLIALVGILAAGLFKTADAKASKAITPSTVVPTSKSTRVKVAYTQCIYRADHPDPILRNTWYESYPVYEESTFPSGHIMAKSYTETQDEELHMTFRRWSLAY